MTNKYILTFPPELIEEPLTYNLTKLYDIKVNILKAEVNSGEEGNLLLELEAPEEKLNQGLAYIQKIGVDCEVFSKQISYDQEKCIHCGSCVSVCFPNAIVMNQETWKIEFNREKCIVCELCTKACPLGLFDIHFGDVK